MLDTRCPLRSPLLRFVCTDSRVLNWGLLPNEPDDRESNGVFPLGRVLCAVPAVERVLCAVPAVEDLVVDSSRDNLLWEV